MKIISLNIRAWRIWHDLQSFLEDHAGDTAIFCFQEVFHTTSDETIVEEFYKANILTEIEKILPNHTCYYAATQEGFGFNNTVDYHLQWWNAVFVHKDIVVDNYVTDYLYGSYNSKMLWMTPYTARNYQYITIQHDGVPLTIIHFHGIWNWWGKDDTSDRLEQSRVLKKIMTSKQWHVILLWDYNLSPDTDSLGLLTSWMRNLIQEYGISTTRSKLYTKPLPFADYAIVSNELVVTDFAVPYVEISDHLPLVLTIE